MYHLRRKRLRELMHGRRKRGRPRKPVQGDAAPAKSHSVPHNDVEVERVSLLPVPWPSGYGRRYY